MDGRHMDGWVQRRPRFSMLAANAAIVGVRLISFFAKILFIHSSKIQRDYSHATTFGAITQGSWEV